MNTFRLHLLSPTEQHDIDDVQSFVGEDASGSFGIQPHHQRYMTSLVFGLARFRCADDDWQFLALPGGLLYFVDNQLTICCRRFLIDRDYQSISQTLQQQLLAEEQQLHDMKDGLRKMEEQMLRRLWDLRRNGSHIHED